jgi:pimeloyl-ACP methyl ester carboxylesterase
VSIHTAEPVARGTYEYIDVVGERVYTVHHHSSNAPRAAVLVAGPMGVERERAYRTVVLISRALAQCGFDVLGFDYRGIGESTGDFRRFCASDWLVDVAACASHLRSRLPGVPLLLLGIRAGAVLVSRTFAEGLGDGMMLWAPPKSIREHLLDVMRRAIMADMLNAPKTPPRTREEIVERLERGENVNVEGYLWSPGLWHDALSHQLALPAASESRPWRVVDFKGLPTTSILPGTESHREIVAAERFWEVLPVLRPQTPVLFDMPLTLLNRLVEGRAA